VRDAVEIVPRFRRLRALAIGDVMLDSYLEGAATRLCTEGPVPVVRKTAEQRAPGGAANTAANLRALGADVHLLGLVGRDLAGALLRTALRERGVDDQWLVEDRQASTLHKLRILSDGQYVVRFDEGETRQAAASAHRRLLAHLEALYPRCDLAIVSDYCYGVASDALIARLGALRAATPRVLLVDSKGLHRFAAAGATVVTPNHHEARLLVDSQRAADTGTADHVLSPTPWPPTTVSPLPMAAVQEIGRRLLDLVDAQYAAITLAGHGVCLVARDGSPIHLPADPIARPNDVGAGDSFAAALALALAAGAPCAEAAQIALDAASIAVARPRTAVVQHRELLRRASLRSHTRAADEGHAGAGRRSLDRLATRLNGERAAGRRIVFTNGVFDILHAGHVQLLKQAKALGDVLVVGINSDRGVRRLKGARRPINGERDRLALVAALDPVDYAILFDEDTPTALIRALRPDFHAKGGDYAEAPLPEAEAVHAVGGRVVILPLVGSHSTSSIIERIVVGARPGTGGATDD
jgi:D-beta-D-heptose 7-phosphate kinase/D-beta-D-heptose 1-phosphate adenosyltransferase